MGTPWPRTVDGLLLREAVEADVPAMLAFRNDPEVNRFTVRTHVPPEEMLRTVLAVPTSPTDFGCVVEQDDAVVALGWLDLRDGVGQPGKPLRTEAMIGYVVHPAWSGRGVATGLTRGLLAAAFDDLGVRRVTAACYADNAASVRVLEKVGMRREQHGREDSWHAELGWVDGYTYALLASEWRAAQAG